MEQWISGGKLVVPLRQIIMEKYYNAVWVR